MAFDYSQWKARVAHRSDITGMVTHLTKPNTDGPFADESEINRATTANLIKILKEDVLIGSTTDKGFIVGKTPAVCFQDAPLYGLIQNVEHEYQRRQSNPREKLRYCGIGLAFSKWYVFTKGGRPVFYEKTADAKAMLPESEYWRIVNLNIEIGNTSCIDWTHEREWRLPNNFSFERRFCHILLYDKQCWDFFLELCPPETLHEIYGITVLKSIMM
jgi:hypothetical protein